MVGTPTDDTHSLQEILSDAKTTRPVVKVYNYRGPEQRLAELTRFFRNQHATVEERTTPSGDPKNFVVLHDGPEFIAADALDSLYDAAIGTATITDPESLESMDYPGILSELDHSTFEGYDKGTMIGISRGVEQFAWRAGEGELHAGFQRLSLYSNQTDIYESLADRGIDVHVYGAPDAEVDHPDITVHGYRTEEITRSWFVVFDRDAGERRGLLAWEQVPDDYYGVWTTKDRPIDTMLARIRSAYPPTG